MEPYINDLRKVKDHLAPLPPSMLQPSSLFALQGDSSGQSLVWVVTAAGGQPLRLPYALLHTDQMSHSVLLAFEPTQCVRHLWLHGWSLSSFPSNAYRSLLIWRWGPRRRLTRFHLEGGETRMHLVTSLICELTYCVVLLGHIS